MSDRLYIVYKHTSPNGKVYIGLTKQTLEGRAKNGQGYTECPKFYKAIKKYGWKNFLHEVLATDLTVEEAKAKEIEYIALYRSNEQPYGYNISPGGDMTSSSGETREKISSSAKERWQDQGYREKAVASMQGKERGEEARKNISKAQKARFSNPRERELVGLRQIGKVRSEEAKRKTSESLRIFYEDPEHREALRKSHAKPNRERLAKAVLCVETGEVFEAVIDAANAKGVIHQNIIKVCRGERPRAGGYSWRYVEKE